MNETFTGTPVADEGYVYATYGDKKYLKHVLASIQSLRRYDNERPVALFCSEAHRDVLVQNGIEHIVNHIFILPESHRSITGFKHNVYRFMPYKRNIYLDSDIIWCREPTNLWRAFSAYKFTITGNQVSDLFFGAHKGIGVLKDFLLKRRSRTLRRFGLTYLSRVQSGMIYAEDRMLTEKVCLLAKKMLGDREKTHFRSRKEEHGRSEESCEWSFAMAMSQLKVQVFPWLNGYESPQLDFIDHYTRYDDDFFEVECLLFGSQLIYDLKGLKNRFLQRFLIQILTFFPGKGDYLYVTPYCLHFGWYHQKEPLNRFSEKCWRNVTTEKTSA